MSNTTAPNQVVAGLKVYVRVGEGYLTPLLPHNGHLQLEPTIAQKYNSLIVLELLSF